MSGVDPGLNIFDQMNRQGLRTAGLAEQTVDSANGPQTFFASPQGEPMWLLHGAGDHAGGWSRVAPQLMKAGYRLTLPDLAGHGASEPFDQPLTMEMFLAGVDAVWSRGVREPAILVGNSFGAWLAIVWALRHPERVARIVAVSGGPVTGIRPDLTLTPADRVDARRIWEATVDRSHWVVPDMVLDEVIRKGRQGALGRMSIAGMKGYLMDGRLAEIGVPVDLIWGESDQVVPLEYAHTLAAGIPNARLTTIPACGHIPQAESPEKFVRVLLDVLATPPAGRPA